MGVRPSDLSLEKPVLHAADLALGVGTIDGRNIVIMQQGAAAGGITVLRIDRTREPDEALDAFPSESAPPPAPLPGPWDLPSLEASRRESIERWGALGQDMRVLNGRIEALSATIRTLTYLTVGLMLITSLLLFATLTSLTTGGANVWGLYADVAKWWR